jgi:hypothetical protein
MDIQQTYVPPLHRIVLPHIKISELGGRETIVAPAHQIQMDRTTSPRRKRPGSAIAIPQQPDQLLRVPAGLSSEHSDTLTFYRRVIRH